MPETHGAHPAMIPIHRGEALGSHSQDRGPSVCSAAPSDSSGLSELHPDHSAALTSLSLISLCVLRVGLLLVLVSQRKESTSMGEVRLSWSPLAGHHGCTREWGPVSSQVRAASGSRSGSLEAISGRKL